MITVEHICQSVTSSIFPYIMNTPHTTSSKLLMYFLGFAPCFIILSISVEGLFFATYSAVLLCWVISEKIMRHSELLLRNPAAKRVEESKRADGYVFDFGDVRLALTFLFFVHLGFFGIGKYAFRRYLEVFSNLISFTRPVSHRYRESTSLTPVCFTCLFFRSFYLEPVYRLIPIFSPFSMATLLVCILHH